MSLNNIFSDSHSSSFSDAVAALNYRILLGKVDEVDEGKIACLAPECGSAFRILEQRKAIWVQLLLNALSAGCSLEDLPDAASCDKIRCDCEKVAIECESQGGALEVTEVSVSIPQAADTVDISAEVAANAGKKLIEVRMSLPTGESRVGVEGLDGTTVHLNGVTGSTNYALTLMFA